MKPDDTVMVFRDMDSALAFLRGAIHDSFGMSTLRGLLKQNSFRSGVPRIDDQDALKQVAALLVRGQLKVAVIPTATWGGKQEAGTTEEVPEPVAPIVQETPWVKFIVVDDATGDRIPGVNLKIKLPDGSKKDASTNEYGLIEFNGITPGNCEVTCEIKDPRIETTRALVGTGSKNDVPAGQGKQGKSSKGSSPSIIAKVESHKVRKDESIKSLADANGLTWKSLSKFNWGTDDPKEINEYLRRRVGCTKKTRDGHNYMFDDSDDPGIVYIPTRWKQANLVTERTHVIRVKPASDLFLVLENEEGLPIPGAAYEISFADGSKRSGNVGKSGIARVENPPQCSFEVDYTEEEDILAKSLAASVRKGFDDRKTDELFRLLGYGEEIVHKAIEAYDKYFNDLNGKGLVEDIYQEVTDPDALLAVESLLALNHVENKGNLEIGWTEGDEYQKGDGAQGGGIS